MGEKAGIWETPPSLGARQLFSGFRNESLAVRIVLRGAPTDFTVGVVTGSHEKQMPALLFVAAIAVLKYTRLRCLLRRETNGETSPLATR